MIMNIEQISTPKQYCDRRIELILLSC